MQFIQAAILTAAFLFTVPGQAYDLTSMALKTLAHSAGVNLPGSGRSNYPESNQPPVGMPSASGNFGACRDHFANGVNPVLPSALQSKARALCFEGFAVMHSGVTKTPVYSAEVLNRSRIRSARENTRTDTFFEDARLPYAERATLDDYKSSGYDRGHTSPAGDMPDAASMAQSFSLSNMVPQAPENNRKAWSDIEKATRSYVMRAAGNVYVVTGVVHDPAQCPIVIEAQNVLRNNGVEPVDSPSAVILAARKHYGFNAPKKYDLQSCSIGNGVAVPSHLYKLVYDPTTNRAWAHWLPNTNAARVHPPISYDELVKRTGIDFLPGIRPAS